MCWSTRGGEEAPPFIICNDPLVKKELLPSGAQSTSGCSIALGKLRQKRFFLEQSGACCIVMPCQFLHAWHDEISQGCSVPFLHVGDCVAKELIAANLKPVEYGSNVRVGVLFTDNTLATNCYLDKLESQVNIFVSVNCHMLNDDISLFERNDSLYLLFMKVKRYYVGFRCKLG